MGGTSGRNTRASDGLPRCISLGLINILVPHASPVVPDWFWGNIHDTLINGKLDGVGFACSVTILLTDYEPVGMLTVVSKSP